MLIRANKASGFSLIELLLTVAVLALAAGLGIPALQGTMTAYRLRSSADIVVGELDAARVMAISRGAEYDVTFTSRTVAVVDPLDTSHPPRVAKTLEPGMLLVTVPTSLKFKPRGTCTFSPSTAEGTVIIQIQDTGNSVATITLNGTGKMVVSTSGGSTSD